jgi:Pyrimidine dimer DNA glycosylase
MRLWSLHPSLLDPKGLVALWREALLAQKVLQGKTSGYRFHPQLHRFRESAEPLAAISTYLRAVHDEAVRRGYAFDASKIAVECRARSLSVTRGQLAFERKHLEEKLRQRDPKRFRVLCRSRKVTVHPLFVVVAGKIEPWEKGR